MSFGLLLMAPVSVEGHPAGGAFTQGLQTGQKPGNQQRNQPIPMAVAAPIAREAAYRSGRSIPGLSYAIGRVP